MGVWQRRQQLQAGGAFAAGAHGAPGREARAGPVQVGGTEWRQQTGYKRSEVAGRQVRAVHSWRARKQHQGIQQASTGSLHAQCACTFCVCVHSGPHDSPLGGQAEGSSMHPHAARARAEYVLRGRSAHRYLAQPLLLKNPAPALIFRVLKE